MASLNIGLSGMPYSGSDIGKRKEGREGERRRGEGMGKIRIPMVAVLLVKLYLLHTCILVESRDTEAPRKSLNQI